MDPAKPSLCMVSPNLYPVLAGGLQLELVGGAEVQQSLLARSFAGAGYPMSVVTLDYGQPDSLRIGDITVYRAHRPAQGVPGLRFFHPRATMLWRAMRRADADIYYQRGAGMLTWLVARFCRMYRRRFVFAGASDADFMADLPMISGRRDRWMFQRGLRHAHTIIAQSAAQQRFCARNFGRSAIIVPSCFAGGADMRRDRQGYVLWVANMRRVKRPHLVLELARRLPRVRFKVVGGRGDAGVYEWFAESAGDCGNVEFVGYVPFSEVESHFNGARIFINTSAMEGFPNTFLQAWARGMPVVSFLDGGTREDGPRVIQQVASIGEMARQVEALWTDDVLWRKAGDASKTYFLAHHTVQAALCAYDRCLAPIASQEARPGRTSILHGRA